MDFLTGATTFELLQAITAMPSQGGGGEAGGIFNLIMPFGFVIAIMYFLVIRPQSKKQKEHQDLLNSLKSGDQVVTQGGLLGKVVEVTEGVMTLELGKNVRVKVRRGHIIEKVVPDSEKPSDTKK